ncbi:ATP-grasp domain-containing protein [Neorhizobium sp. DT-125]|uniref:ATP-grasp domain-containing protein n=1 Tax=Neorhizobium sp. DT-125 TaxID=3396163 RepID=UPI003F1C76B9
MRQKAVVMIESSTTGRLFHAAAKRLGCLPVLLSEDAGKYRDLDPSDVVTVFANTRSIEAVAEVCGRLRRTFEVEAILSSSGAYAAVAAGACRVFGLAGADPDAISRCQNKFEQRTQLKAAGLATPSYKSVTTPRDAAEFAAAVGLPVIVKPVVGSGSMGVRLCENLSEVRAQTSHLLRAADFASSPGVLVEEYIDGPEFSIETVGRIVIGITAKHLGPRPFFVEVGHDFPARLPARVKKQVTFAVMTAIDALGLHWGPAHSEFRLGPKGPVIIEINPRLAGDFIPELVKLAYGIDLVEETIKLALGRPVNLTARANQCAGIRFLNPDRDGVLRWHCDPARARAVEGIIEVEIHAPEGSPILRRGDFRDRIAHVIAATPRSDHTITALEQALALLDARIAERRDR